MVTACASSGPDSPPAAAASTFVQAITARDGTKACALLTPKARQSVVGATDEKCPSIVLGLHDKQGSVSRTQVWGDDAQITIGTDTLYLLRSHDGWRVDAAGSWNRPADPTTARSGPDMKPMFWGVAMFVFLGLVYVIAIGAAHR